MNRITPTGVMADIDPLGWGTLAQQQARQERRRQREQERLARRQRPRAPKTHRWPEALSFTDRFRRLVAGHRPADPTLPAPVSVYAGRYEAAIMWREDIETFAAFLTDTNSAGELEARWVGAHPAQYPTVQSLAEALNAYGIGLDQGSLALAHTYQRSAWAAVGACSIVGTSFPDERRVLAVVTPKGRIQPLAPSPQRDRRSMPFGPPASCTWGQGDARGVLETARIVLDYTESTSCTDDQLFHDARTLAATTVRGWPATFSVSIADLHAWSRTRTPIPVATAGPAISRLQRQPPPVPVRVPAKTRPPHPEVVRLRSGPSLAEVAAAAISHAVDLTVGQPAPIERPPKRRPPISHDALQY